VAIIISITLFIESRGGSTAKTNMTGKTIENKSLKAASSEDGEARVSSWLKPLRYY
jgi:xanthine/uracil permease